MTPKEWFDQFPAAPPGWSHEQWCWRHWAPAPMLGANGIGCAMDVIHLFVTDIAPKRARSATALNAAMTETGKLCCTLGDEKMYELWSQWPPPPEKVEVE